MAEVKEALRQVQFNCFGYVQEHYHAHAKDLAAVTKTALARTRSLCKAKINGSDDYCERWEKHSGWHYYTAHTNKEFIRVMWKRR